MVREGEVEHIYFTVTKLQTRLRSGKPPLLLGSEGS